MYNIWYVYIMCVYGVYTLYSILYIFINVYIYMYIPLYIHLNIIWYIHVYNCLHNCGDLEGPNLQGKLAGRSPSEDLPKG